MRNVNINYRMSADTDNPTFPFRYKNEIYYYRTS